MQREITTSVDLLDAGGKLLNPGWQNDKLEL